MLFTPKFGKIFLIATLLVLSLFAFKVKQVNATVPSWIKIGVAAVYDNYSSNPKGVGAVQCLKTYTVTNMNATVIYGTWLQQDSYGYGYSTTSLWIVNKANPNWQYMTNGAFWIDLANLDKIHGPYGEPLTLLGQSPFSIGGRTWANAYSFLYSNEETGVQYHLWADSKTGLVLEYAEIYPSLWFYDYFRYININLPSS